MEQLDQVIDNIGTLPRDEQFRLLEAVMNELYVQGVLGKESLRQVALEVMAIDYRENDDLLCFDCHHDDLHEH